LAHTDLSLAFAKSVTKIGEISTAPFIADRPPLCECRLMKKLGLLIVAGFVGLILIVVLWVMGGYNGFVRSSQEVDKQWAQVETVYQRRADLIPNLVKTVEGAANFEKSTLVEVTQARASVGQVNLGQAPKSSDQLQQFQSAQDKLSGALSRLLVVAERYPDLKSNSNFLQLQAQLEGTENRISVERNKFNEVVQRYNTKVQSMPGAILAGMFHFQPRPYFKATAGAETAPKVEFNFGNQKTATPPTPAPAR
jgi:LemA protein